MPDSLEQQNINNDLGLGSRVAEQSRSRYLNRDGSFNVRRVGQNVLESLTPYHALCTISWIRFHTIVALSYFVTNVAFAGGYLLCGPGALRGVEAQGTWDQFLEAFFFSVQTLATIGYGRISPIGVPANALVSIEALVGLLGFALVTGLLFARFSRPSANIKFSTSAVIAPYHGITAFEFRLANGRSNQLIEVNVSLNFSRDETHNGVTDRKFYQLPLERKSVVFVPLHWVVVHPIDEKSPLFGVTRDAFNASDPEFMILLTATDETFSQSVHSRTSYKGNEVVWGAKFADMYLPDDGGVVGVDLRKLDDIVEAGVRG